MKFETMYVRLLKRNRTTVFDLVKLVITKKLTVKEAVEVKKYPIEVYARGNGTIDDEEILTTRMGLKLIDKKLTVAYNGDIYYGDSFEGSVKNKVL